jgi:hypothetical protein
VNVYLFNYFLTNKIIFMKTFNYIIAVMIVAATQFFTVSCKKEISGNLSNENGTAENGTGASGIIDNGRHVESSPWKMVSSGVSISQRGIIEMSEPPDQNTCYGIIYDANDYYGDLLHDITITHDGGNTWHSQTIPVMNNNWLLGVAATTPNIVHVFGWNYVTGGGNLFRSTNGEGHGSGKQPTPLLIPQAFRII